VKEDIVIVIVIDGHSDNHLEAPPSM